MLKGQDPLRLTFRPCNSLGQLEKVFSEAAKAVSAITRKELNEIRRLNDPPKTILRTLELLHLILVTKEPSNGRRPDWITQV